MIKRYSKGIERAFGFIQDYPMKVQRGKIDEVFESWRGDVEQVDDVYVSGCKTIKVNRVVLHNVMSGMLI